MGLPYETLAHHTQVAQLLSPLRANPRLLRRSREAQSQGISLSFSVPFQDCLWDVGPQSNQPSLHAKTHCSRKCPENRPPQKAPTEKLERTGTTHSENTNEIMKQKGKTQMEQVQAPGQKEATRIGHWSPQCWSRFGLGSLQIGPAGAHGGETRTQVETQETWTLLFLGGCLLGDAPLSWASVFGLFFLRRAIFGLVSTLQILRVS